MTCVAIAARPDCAECAEYARYTHHECDEWLCGGCGAYLGGDGPIGCPCNTSWFTRLLLRVPRWLGGLR